jgi:hypothetical protein
MAHPPRPMRRRRIEVCRPRRMWRRPTSPRRPRPSLLSGRRPRSRPQSPIQPSPPRLPLRPPISRSPFTSPKQLRRRATSSLPPTPRPVSCQAMRCSRYWRVCELSPTTAGSEWPGPSLLWPTSLIARLRSPKSACREG